MPSKVKVRELTGLQNKLINSVDDRFIDLLWRWDRSRRLTYIFFSLSGLLIWEESCIVFLCHVSFQKVRRKKMLAARFGDLPQSGRGTVQFRVGVMGVSHKRTSALNRSGAISIQIWNPLQVLTWVDHGSWHHQAILLKHGLHALVFGFQHCVLSSLEQMLFFGLFLVYPLADRGDYVAKWRLLTPRFLGFLLLAVFQFFGFLGDRGLEIP